MTGAFDYLDPSRPWAAPVLGEPSLWTLNAAQPGEPVTIRIPKGRQIAHRSTSILRALPGS